MEKMKKRLLVLLMMIAVSGGSVFANESTAQNEMDQLRQRVAELEKKHETAESKEAAGLEKISDKITFGGWITGIRLTAQF
jgi:hypothetical protein